MRKVLPIILVIAALGGAYYAWRATRGPGRTGPSGPILTVTFLDARLGGGIVAQTPDGEVAIIDPGPESGAANLVDYLQEQVTDALTVVVTNPSPNRAGALRKLLESVNVKRIVRGEMDSDSPDWTNALDEARRREIPELVLSAGDGIGISRKVRFEVLSPPKGLIEDTDPASQTNSIVARMVFGRTRILLASDAGTDGEASLIGSRTDLRADVLSVGRRGGSDATSLEFVSFVRPRYFVVTAGGRLGRPDRAVLSRIGTANTGGEVYRTDREGRIALMTDGRTIAVETERGGRE